MLELQINTSKTRSFLSLKKALQIVVELRVPQLEPSSRGIPVSMVLDRVLAHSPGQLPPLKHCKVSKEGGDTLLELTDFRGRPREELKNLKHNLSEDNREEEVFYTDGSLVLPPQKVANYPESTDELQRVPFSYSVHSKFNRFGERGSIVHELNSNGSEGVKNQIHDINIARLSRMIPLELDHIRLGFESYRSTSFGSMFGVVPKVERRSYLEISRNKISLKLSLERANTLRQVGSDENTLICALDSALSELQLHPSLQKSLLDTVY